MVFPSDASIGGCRNFGRDLRLALENRVREREAVSASAIGHRNRKYNSYSRKLMTIDYIGTALSLGGCTLVMLPLIWVCHIFVANPDCTH